MNVTNSPNEKLWNNELSLMGELVSIVKMALIS